MEKLQKWQKNNRNITYFTAIPKKMNLQLKIFTNFFTIIHTYLMNCSNIYTNLVFQKMFNSNINYMYILH